MELRQLRYFVSAARHLNFTKAAEECCVVQSAMSQQITALEKEVETPLFERTNRGLRLTPEGEAMLREARRLLFQAQQAQESVRRAREGFVGQLRVGSCGNLLHKKLPVALARFRECYPRTRVTLRSGDRAEMMDDLREDRIDCLLTLYEKRFSETDWLQARPLEEETVYVMLPEGDPLADEESLYGSQIYDRPLVLFDGGGSSPASNAGQATLARAISGALVAPMDCAEALVAAGCGISFCAGSAIRSAAGIIYRRMAFFPPVSACMLWRRDIGDATQVEALSSLLVMASTE